MKTKRFSVADQSYELRVWSEGSSTFVQCFLNGAPATLRFSVNNEVESELLRSQGANAVEQLVRIAVGDVISANKV